MFKRSHHINLAHRWIEKPAELINRAALQEVAQHRQRRRSTTVPCLDPNVNF